MLTGQQTLIYDDPPELATFRLVWQRQLTLCLFVQGHLFQCRKYLLHTLCNICNTNHLNIHNVTYVTQIIENG